MSNKGDYALSIDVDVSLWMDYRKYNGELPLRYATQDFIVVNFELHDAFDEFKRKETKSHISYLTINELLRYFCITKLGGETTIKKFGKTYIILNSEEIDMLVEWVSEMRQQYGEIQSNVFETSTILLVSASDSSEFM